VRSSASTDVAIIGMACVFPGARDLDEFWENLRAGRDAIVDSYAQFLREARVLSFDSEAPIVDVIGDAAVTVTPWTVRYEREGTIYDETGGDLLVLARDPEGWKVAWRTLLPREAADG